MIRNNKQKVTLSTIYIYLIYLYISKYIYIYLSTIYTIYIIGKLNT